MPLINCKVETKLIWPNHCVLSAVGADNDNANPNNIIFTMKDTKLYVFGVTLSAKDNQKLSKLPRKRSERSVYWNEFKTKSENKSTTNDYKYFLGLKFVGVNGLLVLVYSNQDANSKRLKTQGCHLPKVTIDTYNIIINGKKFMTKQMIQT